MELAEDEDEVGVVAPEVEEVKEVVISLLVEGEPFFEVCKSLCVSCQLAALWHNCLRRSPTALCSHIPLHVCLCSVDLHTSSHIT